MPVPREHVAAHCALDDCPDAVISIDGNDRVVRWNDSAALLLGLAPTVALGRRLTEVLTLRVRDTTGRFPDRHWAAALDGNQVPVELTRWSSHDHGIPSRHFCLRDASARVKLEGEQETAAIALRRQARSDALTGLANRYEFEERLGLALRLADAPARLALMVVDLDGFKPINDSYGHAVGDEVLSAVGRRLAAAVRGEDTVARFGGDEFVVLSMLRDGTSPSAVTARLRAALSHPISTTAGPLTVGASVGIAVAESGSDAQDLLRRADKAMYRVKLARTTG